MSTRPLQPPELSTLTMISTPGLLSEHTARIWRLLGSALFGERLDVPLLTDAALAARFDANADTWIRPSKSKRRRRKPVIATSGVTTFYIR